MTKKDDTQKSRPQGGVTKFNVTTDETTAAMLLAAQEAGRPINLTLGEEAARVVLGDDVIDGVQRILECDEDDFAVLCEVAGLNKSRDFINADLAGIELNCDLAEFNFRGTNLRGASFVGAKNLTKVISFEGADISEAQMTEYQFGIMKKDGAIGNPVIRPATAGSKTKPEGTEP